MVKRVPLALAARTSPSRRRPLRSHDTRRPSSSCTMTGSLLTGGGRRFGVAAGASGVSSSSSRTSDLDTCATFGCGSNSCCVNPMGCVAVKATTMGGNRGRNLVMRARNHVRPPAGP
eukprot:scaffold23612_cov66-Phaeocystis_antarctica.AAC.3